MEKRKETTQAPSPEAAAKEPGEKPKAVTEIGGRKGLDPTRYGDWEVKGRCVDF